MLSLKILNILKISRNNNLLSQRIRLMSTPESSRDHRTKDVNYDYEKLRADEEIYGKPPHNDRRVFADETDKPPREPFVELDIPFIKMMQTEINFTIEGLTRFFTQKYITSKRDGQRSKDGHFKIFGADIAAAYFAVVHDGKAKFKNVDKWFGGGDDDLKQLPKKYAHSYVLIGIDMSDVELFYEGLENFSDCPKVKTAIFQRSPMFDEWFADRISHLFPNLEYLDLTDCPQVTERVLEALYPLTSLKTLIITNVHKTASFELTCIMLQDILPNLKITILEPKEGLGIPKKNP